MKSIRNTTTRPIRVPLPRGKILHLSPRKTGEIVDQAASHPPLVKLVEAGDLEILGDGAHSGPSKDAPGSKAASQDHHPGVKVHRRGDR